MSDRNLLLAHGVGSRADLPIPFWLVLSGAGTVVFATFLALLVLWPTARLERHRSWSLPAVATRILDAQPLRRTAQGVALGAALVVTTAALAGPADVSANIAPWALYVTFWVGLVPTSLLLGPVWRVVNPLRLVSRLLPAVRGPASRAAQLDRLGYWPAAAALLPFLWLELVYPERSNPTVVGVFLLCYAGVQLAASMWFGERWFERGDGFEVYSTLLGRLAPIGRDAYGRLVLRNPLRGAARIQAAAGLPAVLVVLVGSTAFDGLSRTRLWQEGPGAAQDIRSGTLGLLMMLAAAGAVYLAGAGLTGLRSGLQSNAAQLFASSLVPIAAGYAVAHYFSLLVLDGQTTWILASNPFAQDGVDLFGTYRNIVDYTLINPPAIALVQVVAIVLGHLLGVLLAHDRGLGAAPIRASAAASLPLVLAMIVYTVGGLAMLFGT